MEFKIREQRRVGNTYRTVKEGRISWEGIKSGSKEKKIKEIVSIDDIRTTGLQYVQAHFNDGGVIDVKINN